jgi:hypothetical protein
MTKTSIVGQNKAEERSLWAQKAQSDADQHTSMDWTAVHTDDTMLKMHTYVNTFDSNSHRRTCTYSKRRAGLRGAFLAETVHCCFLSHSFCAW